MRIDEAADQPGAGDAVDLRPLARHPDGAALGVARRQLVRGNERAARPRARPGSRPPATLARRALLPQPGGDAMAELQALLADDDGRAAVRAPAPSATARRMRRRSEPGISRGSAAKSSSSRTSMMAGQFGVPTRRASFSAEMVLIDDMMRPPFEWDAMLRHVASWGDRIPHEASHSRPTLASRWRWRTSGVHRFAARTLTRSRMAFWPHAQPRLLVFPMSLRR